MTNRTWIFVCIVLSLCFVISCASSAPTTASTSQTKKPNIVFILADDLGYTDLGCTGSDLYQTPHIDRLAGQSMYFDQAYQQLKNPK